jgi:uncharacterized protein YjeT (DUF2065 family)
MKKKAMEKAKGKEKVYASKTANILVIIACIILVLFGILAVLFSNKIDEAVKNIPALTANFVLTYGIIWIILGILIFTVNKSIIKSNDKAMKWFLLVLGLASLFTGRPEGILIIIASLMYLLKK